MEDYPDHTYLSRYSAQLCCHVTQPSITTQTSSEKFVPEQDGELERRIAENHKKHTGQSPAEADLNLLETARRYPDAL